MTPKHLKTIEDKEFSTEERCHIVEILNEADDRSQSIARARVQTGITTAWHSLKDTTEVYYILEGQGRVELGEEMVQQVEPGDVVRIPANVAQRITNTGVGDLIFLCFCTPAWSADTYIELE